MLKPSSDRLDYSILLAPPAGYQTVYAVGTTYSMDLDALIGACISLGLSESIDSELRDNPIFLLEALKRTTDKVAIFCESGQIQVPYNAKELHILVENMVSEIALKNKKSFHPKFWLVKYENEIGEDLFRCIVLSRNLTFDRSWDIALCIEGTTKIDGRYKYGYEKSRPVSAFVESLLKLSKKDMLSSKKRKIVQKAAKDILNVKFNVNALGYSDFDFFPIGIEDYSADQMGLFTNYHELFVMTPFLSDKTIKRLNGAALKNQTKNILITRKSEIGKLNIDSVSNFDVYVMKDIVVDGEDAISDVDFGTEHIENQKQDIHAKLFLKTKYSDSELFMGSFNASENACNGNIEFMFRLAGKRRILNIDQLKKDIFGEDDKENPFENIEVSKDFRDTGDGLQEQLQKTIKAVCQLKSHAVAEEVDGKYAVQVTFEKLVKQENVEFYPIFSPIKKRPLSTTMIFEEIPLIHLSEFYVLSAYADDMVVKRLIKIPTENIPVDRDQMIYRNIIKDKNGFLQYLAFILGDDYLLSTIEQSKTASEESKLIRGLQSPAMYERMLKTAAHNPSKLLEIKKMMEMLPDGDIVPDSFKELFEVFEEVIKP